MRLRTVPATQVGPEREQLPDEPMCPPHDFDAAWAAPSRAELNGESVPALYCHACGDVRPFYIPEDS